MAWYLAASLVQLTREVNARWPKIPWPTLRIGDGSVGDTSHAARYSSHNPLWTTQPPGAVRAVDIGIEGRDARAILNELIGDPRVWYVIHKGVIYSRTYGWQPRRYTGSNPHNHHIHVSLRESEAAYDDTRPWFGPEKPRRTRPKKSEGDDDMWLDDAINVHDPAGRAETQQVTGRELLTALAIFLNSQPGPHQAYLEAARKSKVEK